MPIRYVFATHAKLQEYLVNAYVRERGLPASEILYLRNRGTFATADAAPGDGLDGDRFLPTSGRNFPAHRRANRAREAAFRRAVLDRCAPDLRVYSAMFTYWYLRELRRRCAHHHILEDGLGSFQSLSEHDHFFRRAEGGPPAWSGAGLRRRLCLTPTQRAADLGGRELLATAGEFLTTSPRCFPWVAAERRVVLRDVFPPAHVGEYAGATILGTSCLVEDRMLDLAAYRSMLGGVVRRIAARGLARLYYKLHPRQAAGPHAGDYRAVIRAGMGATPTQELDQSVSLERLAAGNPITLITGLSTLAFHVHGPGRRVVSYLDAVAAAAPRVLTERSVTGLALFRELSEPL